jgi:hypothetical protein
LYRYTLGIKSIAMEPPIGEDGLPSGPAPRVGFLFIQYADTQAKIKPEKARAQLYRYASPGAIKAGVKAPKLSRIQDRKGWQLKAELYKKNPVVTHSLKAPGDPTLQPINLKNCFQSLLSHSTCTAARRRPTPRNTSASWWSTRCASTCSGGAGYQSNPVVTHSFETAWFQPLSLPREPALNVCNLLVSPQSLLFHK